MSDSPAPKKRGCLFNGCIVALVLAIVCVVTLFFTVRHMINKMILNYTSTTLVVLPLAEVPQQEMVRVQRRWTVFFDSALQNKGGEPLVLSEDDLNALIMSTGTNQLSGKLLLSIDGDRIKAQTSFPLDVLNSKLLRGRYLNGTIFIRLALHDGNLVVAPESILVKDKPLPGLLMNRIRRENFAQHVKNNSAAAARLQNIDSIVVTNRTVILTPKQP